MNGLLALMNNKYKVNNACIPDDYVVKTMWLSGVLYIATNRYIDITWAGGIINSS